MLSAIVFQKGVYWKHCLSVCIMLTIKLCPESGGRGSVCDLYRSAFLSRAGGFFSAARLLWDDVLWQAVRTNKINHWALVEFSCFPSIFLPFLYWVWSSAGVICLSDCYIANVEIIIFKGVDNSWTHIADNGFMLKYYWKECENNSLDIRGRNKWLLGGEEQTKGH